MVASESLQAIIFRRNAIGISFVTFVHSLTRNHSSNISRTVWPRFTKFYMDIHTDILCGHTGYDGRKLLQKLSKILFPTASGGISQERFKRGLPKLTHFSETVCHKPTGYNVTSCFRSALLKFEKWPKMSHPTALFALNLMNCQRCLQISCVENILNVFELSGVAFCLAPPYGGLLVCHSR